jgi:hypothetical protein
MIELPPADRPPDHLAMDSRRSGYPRYNKISAKIAASARSFSQGIIGRSAEDRRRKIGKSAGVRNRVEIALPRDRLIWQALHP